MTAFSKFRQHPETYQAKFKNVQGERLITVYNDGEGIRTEINGVPFSGLNFAELEAQIAVPTDESEWPWIWKFYQDTFLVNFEVSFHYAVDVYVNGILRPYTLDYRLSSKRNQVTESGGTSTKILILSGEEVLFTSRVQESLEQALDEIPESLHLHTCYGCALSDYSPYFAGHSDGNRLTCFRNIKELYKDLSTRPKHYKEAYWIPFRECKPPAEDVHELDICPEFEIRKPGTGYRG